jgi:hypothetical protein
VSDTKPFSDFLYDITLSPVGLAFFLLVVLLSTFAAQLTAECIRRIGPVGLVLLKASMRGFLIAVLGIALTAALVRIGQNSVLLRQLERAIR